MLVSYNRVFIAKAMWQISAPTVIGELEEVVKYALTFENGIEYIKELDGTKFIRVSKKDIKTLLSKTESGEALAIELFKKY